MRLSVTEKISINSVFPERDIGVLRNYFVKLFVKLIFC